jgi:hypothetical protein
VNRSVRDQERLCSAGLAFDEAVVDCESVEEDLVQSQAKPGAAVASRSAVAAIRRVMSHILQWD